MALYQGLLAERPGDEGLMFEMAQAQAWSGDNKTAKETLHDLVGRSPRNVKARLLLAEVHGWEGEFPQAEKIYRSVLADEPDNIDALVGLGEVLSWEGHLPESLEAYDRALAKDPKSRKALEGRAQVLHWQGRAPEALDTIRQALELYPDARDARRLGRDIGGSLRPSLQLFGTTTQDTDDNDLATWGGTYTHYLGAGGYVGVTFTHAQTDSRVDTDPAVYGVSSITPVAQYETLRVIGARHFSRHISLYGEAGPERVSFPLIDVDPNDGASEESRSHASGSLTLEVNGPEWFTLVATASEDRLVGTTQAFMNDVGIRSATVAAIFRPHSRVRLRVAGGKALFTDADDIEVPSTLLFNDPNAEEHGNNGRDLITAGASWKLPLKRPKITLQGNYRWMSYDHDFDQGYFDPDHYWVATGGFDIFDTIGKSFYWSGGIDRGVQVDAQNARDDVFDYRLLAGFNIGDSVSVEGYYSRADQAVASAAGFKSTDAGIRLKIKFGQNLGPASPGRKPTTQHGTSD
jgi:tetratricopeptide (TPR) repeat protein